MNSGYGEGEVDCQVFYIGVGLLTVDDCFFNTHMVIWQRCQSSYSSTGKHACRAGHLCMGAAPQKKTRQTNRC